MMRSKCLVLYKNNLATRSDQLCEQNISIDIKQLSFSKLIYIIMEYNARMNWLLNQMNAFLLEMQTATGASIWELVQIS